jgi:hypothetical protein
MRVDVSRSSVREGLKKFGRPPESILGTHVNSMMKLGKEKTVSVVRDRAEAFDFDRFTGTPRTPWHTTGCWYLEVVAVRE